MPSKNKSNGSLKWGHAVAALGTFGVVVLGYNYFQGKEQPKDIAEPAPEEPKGPPYTQAEIAEIEAPMRAARFHLAASPLPVHTHQDATSPVLVTLEKDSCIVLAGKKEGLTKAFILMEDGNPLEGYVDFAQTAQAPAMPDHTQCIAKPSATPR